MARLRVGVSGVGAMGARHAANLRRLIAGAELVGVADADRARADTVAKELEIATACGSIDELVQRKDIEAVVIASPGKFHASDVATAAAAGKHVFSEKPLGLNLGELDAALAAVAKANVLFQVGHMRRYDPAYVDAAKRIQAGEIGVPVIFKAVGRDCDPPPITYFSSGLNANLFLDSAIHDFDLARWLMGDEVTEVQSYCSNKTMPELKQYNDVEACVVNLRYQAGAVGNVECYRQACYAYDIRTEVIGSKGTIQIGTLRHTPVTVMTSAGMNDKGITHWLDRFSDAYLAEMIDFVDSVRAGRQPKVSGDDGRRAVAMGVAAEQSYREGKPVAVSQAAARRTPAA
jgi:scyllo-inositol 2-dehydrogenase (NAD+)